MRLPLLLLLNSLPPQLPRPNSLLPRLRPLSLHPLLWRKLHPRPRLLPFSRRPLFPRLPQNNNANVKSLLFMIKGFIFVVIILWIDIV